MKLLRRDFWMSGILISSLQLEKRWPSKIQKFLQIGKNNKCSKHRGFSTTVVMNLSRII